MSRNYHAEIVEATMSGDVHRLAALAHEFAGMAQEAARLEAAERERKAHHAEWKRNRRNRPSVSTDVHGQSRTDVDAVDEGSPLVPPSPLPAPNTPPPFNPPSRVPPAGRKPARPSNLDVLPKEFVDAAYARWVADLGSCSYPHLRKALLPVYQAPNAPHPSAEELSEAIGAFLDGRDADSPAWRQKWTVQKFAAELPDWVRLGRMQYVDEWGIPTERGIVAKLFGASA